MIYIIENNKQEPLHQLSTHFYNDNQISAAIVISVHFRFKHDENKTENDPAGC